MTIIEKRSRSDPGRENSVALQKDTVDVLRFFGIYHCLIENSLVYPMKGDALHVRLKDLEWAMKKVVLELDMEVIFYDETKVEQIIEHQEGKADFILRHSNGHSSRMDSIPFFIIAEGAHSHTSRELLKHTRISVLPPIPVITAVFQDDRPQISSLKTFFNYSTKTVSNTATSVYYYSLFLFKVLAAGEHLYNDDRQIAGAVVLQTPKQNYLGCGLGRKQTEKMIELQQKLKAAKITFDSAQRTASPNELVILRAEIQTLEKQLEDFLQHWSGLAFCFANLISLSQFAAAGGNSTLHFAPWYPLKKALITEIGADQSRVFSGLIGKTPYLVAGDILSTVDPSTGRGCSTAINTYCVFHDFLIGLEQNGDLVELLKDHDRALGVVISENLDASFEMRSLYRPDVLVRAGLAEEVVP